jgi:hypothetical protein
MRMNKFPECVFLLLIVLLTLYATALGEVVTSDFNRDGKSDGWSYMEGDRIEKQEIDLNFDGKVDAVYIYDEGGKVVEEVLDTNYDGKMDNWRSYKNGKVVLDKVDSDFDGRADLWVYVEKGGIYRIERDLDGDGNPDKASVY